MVKSAVETDLIFNGMHLFDFLDIVIDQFLTEYMLSGFDRLYGYRCVLP